ncbi:MAG: hypothetical protein E8D46_12320 [Nitrospira sp.]|nr:MAG: hypothetical protein E8D46_12320 [Nitrospira sp.]
MSTDALKQLIGRSVIRVEKVHDHLQLEFSGDAILSIFNNYQYGAGSISSIQGEQLLAVNELGDKISFKFQKGAILSVSMEDAEYNGPEAMVLKRKDEPFIIWN